MKEFLERDDDAEPKAVVGIVEKGLVGPLCPDLRSPEHGKALIVGE